MNPARRVVGIGLVGSLTVFACERARPPVPPVVPPGKVAVPAPNLWAIVVGIDRYANSGIPACPGAADDARDVRDWLVQAAGWSAANVLLMDRNSRRDHGAPAEAIAKLYPNRKNLDWAIRQWLRARLRPNDLVLIYFAGRAVGPAPSPGAAPATPGRHYLLPIDAEAGRWDQTGWAIEEAIDDLATRAENPIVVWLDTSRLGGGHDAAAPGGRDRTALGWLGALARGPTVTACLAADGATPRPGKALVDALGMAPRRDQQARDLLDSLIRFARDEEPSVRGFRMVCGLSPEPTAWLRRPSPTGLAPPAPHGHCDRVRNVAATPLNVAVTPDDRLMISGGADSEVKIWRVDDRSLLRVLPGHVLGVRSLALSPDARSLATGDGSGRVRLWRGPPSRVDEFQQVLDPGRPPDHEGAVARLAFLADGAHLASLDEMGNCLLWDAAGDRLRMIRLAPDREVTDLACGPGRVAVAATALGDGTSRIHFFGITGAPLGTALAGPGGIVNGGRLALAGTLLVAADDEGRVVIWDVGDPDAIREVSRFEIPGKEIRALALSPTTLVLGGGETIYLWTRDQPSPDSSLAVGHLVQQVALADDGRWLAGRTADGGLRIWSLPDGKVPRAATPLAGMTLASGDSVGATSVRFSPRGRFLVAGWCNGEVRAWDLPGGAPRPVVPSHRCGIAALGVSPENRSLLQVNADRTARVWDLPEGRGPAPLAGAWTSGVPLAANQALLMTDVAGDVVLVDRVKGPVTRFPRPPVPGGGGVTNWGFDRVAASPDGRWIVAGSSQGSLACVWDAQGTLVRSIRDHHDYITAVAFSADSRWLLTASYDGTALVWDVREAKGLAEPRWTFPAVHPPDPNVTPITAAIIIAREPPQLITGHVDGRIVRWVIGPEDRPVATDLGSLEGEVRALAAASDGRWLAAAGDDPTLRFWPEGAGGPELRLPLPNTERLTALVGWPDGKLFATGDDHATVRLWGPGTP